MSTGPPSTRFKPPHEHATEVADDPSSITPRLNCRHPQRHPLREPPRTGTWQPRVRAERGSSVLLLDLGLVFHGKIMYDIGAVERWIGPEFGVKLPWSSHRVGPACWIFFFLAMTALSCLTPLSVCGSVSRTANILGIPAYRRLVLPGLGRLQ